MKCHILILAALLALQLSGCAQAGSRNCEETNPALEAMPAIEVSFKRSDGSQLKIPALLANNDATRSAGFQRVCESAIRSRPILFVFQRDVMPRFHMHNVVAPLDIAFIDANGKIDSIQLMKPYVLVSTERPLYGPSKPIRFAFEAHKDFFQQQKISLDSEFSWSRSNSDS